MDPQRRRDVRYRYRLPVVLGHGSRQYSVQSVDVSFRGIFVATDARIALRQLVTVTATLPQIGKFETPAMVVFVAETGRTAGIGVQFYGPSNAGWDQFIRRVSKEAPDDELREVSELRKRREPRTSIVIRVETDHIDQLVEMYTSNISRGGMFLETDHEFKMGSELRVEVVHPETGDTLAVKCVVVRHGRTPGKGGVGVEFLGMTDEQRDEFYQFAYVGSPTFG